LHLILVNKKFSFLNTILSNISNDFSIFLNISITLLVYYKFNFLKSP